MTVHQRCKYEAEESCLEDSGQREAEIFSRKNQRLEISSDGEARSNVEEEKWNGDGETENDGRGEWKSGGGKNEAEESSCPCEILARLSAFSAREIFVELEVTGIACDLDHGSILTT